MQCRPRIVICKQFCQFDFSVAYCGGICRESKCCRKMVRGLNLAAVLVRGRKGSKESVLSMLTYSSLFSSRFLIV